MSNFAKRTLSGTLWLGRGTATIMGLAMLLALTVGLASTALAGVGVNAPFNLGKTNAVNVVSSLVGSVDGPSLKIDNDSLAPGATALDLRVEPGKTPIKVNSGARVTNLNSDRLDGKDSTEFLGKGDKAFNSDKLDGVDSFEFLRESERDDFLPNDTYTVRRDEEAGPGGDEGRLLVVNCDPGDKVLGGGGGVVLTPSTPADTGTVTFSRPDGIAEWDAFVQDNGSPSPLFVEAVCADFPPLR